MYPARGDSKPCDQGTCSGVMRYSRGREIQPSHGKDGGMLWICTLDATHVSTLTEVNRALPIPVRKA